MTSHNTLWLIGVCFAVFGSLVSTVGKQLIRCSELCKDAQRMREGKLLYLLGLVFQVLLYPGCDAASSSMAPASAIAPIVGLDIVWNTAIAPCSLGEKLTARRFVCSALVFFAATASVFFRQIDDVSYTAEYVNSVLATERTMLYAIVFLGWLCLNIGVIVRYPKTSALRGFSIGATAGTLAGNAWCSKVVGVMVEPCFHTDCQAFTNALTWVMLFTAVLFSTSNLYFINTGMQQYEALFMITVYMGSNMVMRGLGAVVVLQELDGAPAWQLGGYLFCILATMAGMIVLTEGEGERSEMSSRSSFGFSKVLPVDDTSDRMPLGATSRTLD
eukprot:TRINITY_DN6275_c0_g1_i1.p1 TRINITY_DN6275_c0_g1~~TRINITY_DN6275_c0_g1_i1.p1  ORF type:complete len:330 (-),score=60.56 TRINITY_DN6275_c0_g1_i1:117-1106(-)